MEIIGYIGAFLMGIVLGAIGSGGSILTVPLLVYLFNVTPTIATGYSLLIVGITAFIGAIRYYTKGMIDIRSATIFAIPSIAMTYITRAYIMPNIPDNILGIDRDSSIMFLFAALMIVSAFMMYKDSHFSNKRNVDISHPKFLIILEGIVVGFITGLLGAGGGFLIMPALVLLMKMPISMAIGSSLFIISLKSLIGFVGDLQSGIIIQMPMILYFIICTVIGMIIATKYFSSKKDMLRQKFFAIFTALVAIFIVLKEIF